MPVCFSKLGTTGSGNSSDHIRRLSSPDADNAFFTRAGPAKVMAPAAAPAFSMVRRLKRLAASMVSRLERPELLRLLIYDPPRMRDIVARSSCCSHDGMTASWRLVHPASG